MTFASILLAILVSIVGGFAVATWLLVDSKPGVLSVDPPSSADIKNARAVFKATLKTFVTGQPTTKLVYSARELNGMLAVLGRAIPRLTGRANISNTGLGIALTYDLPWPLPVRFVNLGMGMDPSDDGLRVNQVTLGRLKLAGDAALGAARVSANILLGEGQGSALVDSVDSVSFVDDRMTVQVTPPSDLGGRMRKTRDRLKVVRDEIALLGDPLVVREYYRKLLGLDADVPAAQTSSLSKYLAAVFTLAADRSNGNAEVAINENRAAILALVIYLGDARFERLVGEVRSPAMKKAGRGRGGVVLGGRRDLRLHFLVSAGLKIATDQGISYAIGEFKEVLDAAAGGSGFSFADLAADRTGVMLASAAVDVKRALVLQERLKNGAREAVFFPNIRTLPEGLTEQEFRDSYSDLNSQEYAAVVAIIDSRIARLRAYHE